MRKLAFGCILVLAAVCVWGLMSSNVSIQINGQEVHGPLKTVVGMWGLIITTVVLFCVAILLAFVFAGVGLVMLGALAIVGLILAGTAFPFLLPLLIPLFVVWVFCAGMRRGRLNRNNLPPTR